MTHVLLAGGVPPSFLQQLVHSALTEEAKEMFACMHDAVKLGSFLTRRFSVRSQRVVNDGLQWLGGLPKEGIDQMLWLLSSGFEPKKNKLCLKLLNDIMLKNQKRLIEKMNIPIGQSTVAFMIPDPFNVLEENECALCFSTPFTDTRTGQQWMDLHDIDVLVARSPVMLPSDIQRIKCVFRPELAHYKDVIIFSSRGSVSVASKLSGGDYDGDKAWVR